MRLRRGGRLGAPLILAVLLCAPTVLAAADGAEGTRSDIEAGSLSVRAYAQRLDAVAVAVRSGDAEEVERLAGELGRCRIEWRGERLGPDAALLGDAIRARGVEASRVARRIDGLVRMLESEVSPKTAEAPQAAILAKVTLVDPWQPGGAVAVPSVPPPPGIGARLQWALEKAGTWMKEWLEKFLDWLRRIWPRPRRAPPTGDALSRTTVIVLATVALATAALVILALRAFRRESPSTVAAIREVSAASRRDSDPMSREANEWERYAETLAAAGRRREAIRAWYHAVLVTLFRGGVLHYERGRTNWEYVAALQPGLPWRRTFIELTLGFDREWYGHESSTQEALGGFARIGRGLLRAIRGGGGRL